jgi:hypothetical protein
MKLQTEGHMHAVDATEREIQEAFLDDAGRGEFTILSRSDEVYMQAAGEGDGPFTLEFRDGDAQNHFRCVREPSKSEVERAFLKYLAGDDSWRADFSWQKLEFKPCKPWWRFWQAE